MIRSLVRMAAASPRRMEAFVSRAASRTDAPASAETTLVNRELSWLSFNERVLQEAADTTVPLLERLFFCGVFSSNLDEFFSVRVASLRELLRLGKKDAGSLGQMTLRMGLLTSDSPTHGTRQRSAGVRSR